MELNNYHIELVEEIKGIECIEDLRKAERRYIESNECVNRRIPGRTMEEWQEANREKICAYQREYRDANKEKMREYYETNREKIREYREANKEKIREYRETNREKNRAYQLEYYETNKEKIREYREANKEKISARNREKVTCEYCGAIVTRCNLLRHQKAKKCMAARSAS